MYVLLCVMLFQTMHMLWIEEINRQPGLFSSTMKSGSRCYERVFLSLKLHLDQDQEYTVAGETTREARNLFTSNKPWWSDYARIVCRCTYITGVDYNGTRVMRWWYNEEARNDTNTISRQYE